MNRKCVPDTYICLYLCHPYINFKYLFVGWIFNMLSIIVKYYFCVGFTHKSVTSPNLSSNLLEEIPHGLHYKMLSETFENCRKCQILLNLLPGVKWQVSCLSSIGIIPPPPPIKLVMDVKPFEFSFTFILVLSIAS